MWLRRINSLLLVGCFSLLLPLVGQAAIHAGVHTKKLCAAGVNPCDTATISTTTGGDLSMHCIYYDPDGPVTVSDSQGLTWTQVQSTHNLSVGGATQIVYRAKNTSGSGSHTGRLTRTATAGPATCFFTETLEVDTTSPFDQSSIQGDGSNPEDATSITTTSANELIWAFYAENSSSGTCSHTFGNSFTLLDEETDCNNQFTGAVGYLVVTSTGTYTATANVSGSYVGAGQIVMSLVQGTGGSGGGGGGGGTSRSLILLGVGP